MEQSPVSPGRILELAQGFMVAKTVLSAVELGLFTVLAEMPLDAEVLGRRLGLHPRGRLDFLDGLVALGLLERDAAGRYSNTPETACFLDRDQPTYVGGILEMMNARLYGHWGGLTAALLTGAPQNEARGGGDTFAALYADPARLEQFLAGMTGVSRGPAQAIARALPWQRYRTLVDIGAAQGCVPVTVAQAHPHLTGGGFDLPVVGPIFERYVGAHGLADRLRFYPGDFFQDDLPRADVLVMGHILHDWDLATKRLLLAKAYAALPPGGALVIYDAIIDDERRQNVAGLMMSLNMLIETPGGFDYTGAQCAGWLREAGFATARVTPLEGGHALIVAEK